MNIARKMNKIIFFVVTIHNFNVLFAGDQFTLNIENKNGIKKIEKCANQHCQVLKLPNQLADYIAENFEVKIGDIDEDGEEDLEATNNHGNQCVYFYKMAGNELVEFTPTIRRLCNYSEKDGYLFSKYKDGTVQYEDVYRRTSDAIKLFAQDQCIGCDQVFRTTYRNNAVFEKKIVSSEIYFFDRKQLTGKVTSQKARLYASASNLEKTKSYLIKNDTVLLSEYADISGDWYRVIYKRAGHKALSGWLQCKDLDFCSKH